MARSLEINGARLAVEIKVSPRARRLSLRLDPLADAVVLVRPQGTSEREALAFLDSRRAWVGQRLATLPPRRPFAHGETLPLRGQPHRLVATGQMRGAVAVAGEEIHIPGDPAGLPRRLTDFLKQQARADALPLLLSDAAHLGRPTPRLVLRDPGSRWGSCSSTGTVSLSWRLILAPPPVLRYVVAHEAAHLVELNHSPRFWAVLGTLVAESMAPRRWLKEHGTSLHRYG